MRYFIHYIKIGIYRDTNNACLRCKMYVVLTLLVLCVDLRSMICSKIVHSTPLIKRFPCPILQPTKFVVINRADKTRKFVSLSICSGHQRGFSWKYIIVLINKIFSNYWIKVFCWCLMKVFDFPWGSNTNKFQWIFTLICVWCLSNTIFDS